ncbi:phenazine biosynthesis protein phzE [Allocatelliglobosispora scoriae]|uniref:anthranilate synthase n=1 Tax=Allocatelliglobosispora scoriae TaxID=643052 RepID=A0A841C2U3_9ACTN|nr:chorismate-binding protein [Allocatelliglobosispora scoriae]MBB5873629.1 phenazine biosynthesis protein phzE [Allocatelliglobosispora scoriae]
MDSPDAAACALLYRPETDPDTVELILGTPVESHTLETAMKSDDAALVLLPYRQITERGYACHDDGEPIVTIEITDRIAIPLDSFIAAMPNTEVSLADGEFDISDAAYAASVREIIDQEIGAGEGSNFVIKRSYHGCLADYSPSTALTIFQRLLRQEHGTYWTFLVSFGGRTLVGASPESHLRVDGDLVTMNPISGTYRYPAGEPDPAGLQAFLDDRKETDELYMVLDEELKMMARICDEGGTVIGPRLRQMARLAHTEYHISGTSKQPLPAILRETLLAPTVTGSPVENACRVIHRREPTGRGYYSGVIALVEPNRRLDAAIVIRTADITADGDLTLSVGATLVRHSDPATEVLETHAKVAGMLAALSGERAAARTPVAVPAVDAAIEAQLEGRNADLAPFWLGRRPARKPPTWRTLVIDAEDTFTDMFAVQLRHLGHDVTVRTYREVSRTDGWDLVVLGPGPGDPRDGDDPKIARLRTLAAQIYASQRPLLAVCLGHQILSHHLGLPLVRLEHTQQGRQRTIEIFDETATVGFYNTFVAQADTDRLGTVMVSRDPATKEVFAMHGPNFRSFQFHPESILSADGLHLLGRHVGTLLAP